MDVCILAAEGEVGRIPAMSTRCFQTVSGMMTGGTKNKKNKNPGTQAGSQKVRGTEKISQRLDLVGII